jgi:hypothetical protein
VDELGMIITPMGKHNRSEMVAEHRALCTLLPVTITITVTVYLVIRDKSV